MFYTGDRADVAESLENLGWQTTATPSADLMAGNGRAVPDGLQDAVPHRVFVEVRR